MAQPISVASPGAAAPGQPFGLAGIARLLRERGRVVRDVAGGFVALTIIAMLIWPPSYSTTAVVMLDPRRNNVTDRSQVLSELPTNPASVQNQIQILESRDLAALVIKRLGLAGDPEFDRTLAPFPLNLRAWGLSPDERHSMIVDMFLKHLTVEAEGLSTAVSVTFSAEDPGNAARITNAIVQAYVDAQVDQKVDAAHRTTEWLAARIRELARQVQSAEAAAQAYKAANDLNDTGQGTQSLADQQLAAINTELVQARADLAEKEATYEHVAALVKSGHATNVSQVVSSPLIAQLREQQANAIRNETDLDSRYGPKPPSRIAVESQVRDLDSKIEQEAERIAGSVANDVAVARAQVQFLEASLASARTESNAQNLARVKLKEFEAGTQSTRAMYESFVTRLREAQDQDAVTMADARIISHSTVPAKPSSPPRLLAFGASIPAGLLLGLLCALVMERMGYEAPRRRAVAADAQSPLVPTFGLVQDALTPRAADQIVTDPSSPFAQAILGLARRLVWSVDSAAPRIILVSGLDGREGRTNVAVGLARALALLGQKVLVIDADFVASAAAWTMGVDRAHAGLLDVLRGTQPLSRAAAKDSRSPALVLASAAPPSNPAALWRGQEAKNLLQHLRQTCDFIIIDAPVDSETSAISRLCDATLMVGRSDKAAQLQVASAALFAAGTPVAGIVLTS